MTEGRWHIEIYDVLYSVFSAMSLQLYRLPCGVDDCFVNKRLMCRMYR